MSQLNIKLLEQYSGIKAHTIRAWEQRFDIFQPSRSPGNRRIYDLIDLRLLLDLALLLKHGYSISRLTNIAPATLHKKIGEIHTTLAIQESTISRLILSYLENDFTSIESNLNVFSLNHDVHQCLEQIVIPFIHRIGLFYYVDQQASTHFLVNALRKKILHATDALAMPDHQQPSAVLFLPPGEHFDLLLLCFSYQLRASGTKVYYLGTNVDTDVLKNVITNYHPEFLITYVSPDSRTKRSGKAYLSDLSRLDHYRVEDSMDVIEMPWPKNMFLFRKQNGRDA